MLGVDDGLEEGDANRYFEEDLLGLDDGSQTETLLVNQKVACRRHG